MMMGRFRAEIWRILATSVTILMAGYSTIHLVSGKLSKINLLLPHNFLLFTSVSLLSKPVLLAIMYFNNFVHIMCVKIRVPCRHKLTINCCVLLHEVINESIFMCLVT